MINLKNYKLVFDFDGTLVDSMGVYVESVLDVLKKNNVNYPDDIFKIITPLGYKGSAEYFVEKLGLNMTVEEILNGMKEIATKAYENDVLAKETVIETLKKLKAQGISLNVLTASPHSNLDACLKRLGIWELFDRVWSCEDFKTTKSDVNIYHMVAEELGTKTEQCVFFDDNINAIMTGKRSGMKVVGVYDETSAAYVDEMKAVSDMYIYRFAELIE